MHIGAGVDAAVELTLLDSETAGTAGRAPAGETALSAALRYRPADPYAVSVVFRDGARGEAPTEAVTWTFDRDLMRAGLDGPAGIGDVRLQPASDRPGAVYLELIAPGGRALLAAPATALRAFLDATAVAVPFGRERDVLDIDGAIEALLGRS